MGMVNPLNAYRETKVKSASQGQLVVMLYAETVKQLDIALDYMAKDYKKNPGFIEKINIAVIKTQDIITELMASLDFEAGGEIALNLFSLYNYFNRELTEGNIKKNPDKLKFVRTNMAELKEAWTQAVIKAGESAQSAPQGVNIAG